MTLREWRLLYPDNLVQENYLGWPVGHALHGDMAVECKGNMGQDSLDLCRLSDYKVRSDNGGCCFVLQAR